MSHVAIHEIQIADAKGKVQVFKPGEVVKVEDKDELDRLIALGAVAKSKEAKAAVDAKAATADKAEKPAKEDKKKKDDLL